MTIKLKAALKISTLTPDALVTKTKNMLALIVASPYFASITWPIPLPSVNTAIDDLHSSIIATATNAAGAVSYMHEKQRIVIALFNVLRPIVELTANNTIDPKTVIEAVGMVAVEHNGNTHITELTLTALGNGVIEVHVPRKAGQKAFVYEYSTDAGITWQAFGHSKLQSMQLKNQTPASTLYFRFAPIGNFLGAYSDVKKVIVL